MARQFSLRPWRLRRLIGSPPGFRALITLIAAGLMCVPASAHPMGNFSVSHYARIEPTQGGADILYVLDLAEIPTFELMQKWNVTAGAVPAELQTKGSAEAQEWTRELNILVDGRKVVPAFLGSEIKVSDGAGGMPVMRIASRLRVSGHFSKLEYEDRNYPQRTGWKEIVVAPRDGMILVGTARIAQDRSNALTAYPQDPTVAPPQELKTVVEVRGNSIATSPQLTRAQLASARVKNVAAGAVSPEGEQSQAAEAKAVAEVRPGESAQVRTGAVPTASGVAVTESAGPVQTGALQTGSAPPQAKSMGVVKRGDFLSRSLMSKDIGWGLMVVCLGVAFLFGALHALEPGHGKTMVAAYLVGSHGTVKHAIFLGGMVTFTHTASVFLLGFVTKFLSLYILPETVSKYLGTLAGLSIVWLGGMLLYKRLRSIRVATGGDKPGHPHSHGHIRDHSHHQHSHANTHHGHEHYAHEHHAHEDAGHIHIHADGTVHTHVHSPGRQAEHLHEAEPAHAVEHVHAQHATASVGAAAVTGIAHLRAHSKHQHADGTWHSHSHEGHQHAHDHGHSHSHGDDAHDHQADGHQHQDHAHGATTHTHDGHTHSHLPEGEISFGSLVALGVSGGLVPCPSALVLLLSAISVNRIGFGLLLLLAFSLGLALVLMAIGMAVLFAKNFIPKRHAESQSQWARYLSLASAAVIIVVGVVMTGVSMGIIPAIRFLG